MKALFVVHLINDSGHCTSYERFREDTEFVARLVGQVLNTDDKGNGLPPRELPDGKVCRKIHDRPRAARPSV